MNKKLLYYVALTGITAAHAIPRADVAEFKMCGSRMTCRKDKWEDTTCATGTFCGAMTLVGGVLAGTIAGGTSAGAAAGAAIAAGPGLCTVASCVTCCTLRYKRAGINGFLCGLCAVTTEQPRGEIMQ